MEVDPVIFVGLLFGLCNYPQIEHYLEKFSEKRIKIWEIWWYKCVFMFKPNTRFTVATIIQDSYWIGITCFLWWTNKKRSYPWRDLSEKSNAVTIQISKLAT